MNPDLLAALRNAPPWVQGLASVVMSVWALCSAIDTVTLMLPAPLYARLVESHPLAAHAMQLVRRVGSNPKAVANVAAIVRLMLGGDPPPPDAGGTGGPTAPPARPDNGGSAMRSLGRDPLTHVLGATFAALLLAAACAAGCGGRTWQDRAHAAINTAAHGLGAADALVSDAIDRDTRNVSYDALEHRYRPAVTAMATLRAALVAAQAAVDTAAAAPGAERTCAAMRDVQIARDQAAAVSAALREAGIAIPAEVDQAATLCAQLAAELGPRCEVSDAGR